MNQILHIKKNKAFLDKRWELIRKIREFFWTQNFQEVETPLIVQYPGQEPYLDPIPVRIHNEYGEAHAGYLHTSPEYSLKKMLAAGYTHIFSLGKTFRDCESFGGLHNPEFTMLEWYRAGANMNDLMQDLEQLLPALGYTEPVERISMKQLWQEVLSVELDDLLTKEALFSLCQKLGYALEAQEEFVYVFYRIFLNEIEPVLKNRGAVIIHSFPAQLAALAKISQKDPRYAERFELYINGIEVANAFSELTDPKEQRQRFEEEQKNRAALKKPHIQIDEEFLAALEYLPESAGIALGVDRLIQSVLQEEYLDRLLPFGAKQLWHNS